jgi:peptidoglycan/LPS O-acetylase OafA/YrhL
MTLPWRGLIDLETIDDAGTPGGKVRLHAKTGYIKTLDGWRAIAVFGVIFFHARAITAGPPWLGKLQAFGENGVQLFFAISGFLICSRLLEEGRLRGQVSLRGFYVRRFFRIQPPALVFLAVIGLLAAIGAIHTTLPATLSALFFFRNYYAVNHGAALPDDVYTAHFWSLAVEEHFYLLLPGLLFFGRKKILPLLATLTMASCLWAFTARFILRPSMPELEHWRTDIALHSLFTPALLAVLLLRPSFRQWMTTISSRNLLIGLTMAALLISEIFLKGHFIPFLISIGFPLIVVSTVLHPEGWLGQLLESLPFVFVGRLSYSLYLWQQLFFTHEEGHSVLRSLQSYPLNVIAVLACAIASYYLVEKPLMRLGHRLAPPATPGRTDLDRSRLTVRQL